MSQHETVKEYYGKVLKTKQDLQTSVCCTAESLPAHVRPIAKELHPTVVEKFYGCGSPLPLVLEGQTVLDLGCGSGRDVYLLSKLVGPSGRVIGLDMTQEQLDVAKEFESYHMQKFGFKESNVRFVQGYIEDLKSADIADNSVDVVVSNCVVNLSPDKESVFSEIFRVLKPGGELYFSDIFADRRLPKEIQQDDLFIGECLGGALYTEDFRRMLNKFGCPDFRIVSNTQISLNNPVMAAKSGLIRFFSTTVRAFKLDLEDRCEDFGQVAYYKGTIPEAPHYFDLDDHHRIETGKAFPVCGNTAAMLTSTRFKDHFRVEGNQETHYGLFDCGPAPVVTGTDASSGACC